MAQIRKYASGGSTVQDTTSPYIASTDGLRYVSSDAIAYLKNTRQRNHYSKMYKKDSDYQNALFNAAVDKYVEGIENGEIIFSESGLRRKDGTQIEGIDPVTDAEVQKYFISGVRSQLIPAYNERYKPTYTLKNNLRKVISKFQFGDPNFGVSDNGYNTGTNSFSIAWNSLDPMDKETGLRGIENRKAAYVSAIRQEANRLRTDANYRKRFKFNGWFNNLNAYEDMATKLENHANSIENLSKIDLEDDSWFTTAALAGIDPNDVVKYFQTDTEKSLAIKREKEQQEAKDKAKAEKQHQENLKKTIENYDPLSTKDALWWHEGTPYTINDDWQNLDNEDAKIWAQGQLQLYGREKIQDYWGYWRKYKGKYLENLTPLFTGIQPNMGVYAVTRGALGNTGKEFFIKRNSDLSPIKVSIKQAADGTYYATDGANTYILGAYDPNSYATIQRALNGVQDKGEPVVFERNRIFKSIQSVNDYWNNELLTYNPATTPVTTFWDMLYKLSNIFLQDPQGYNSGNKLYRGSSFALSGNTFVWSFRGHSIRFIFQGKPTVTSIGGNSVLNASNLAKVEIVKNQYKSGGAINKLATGGEFMQYQRDNKTAKEVTITDLNAKPQKQGLELPIAEILPQGNSNQSKGLNTYGGQEKDQFTGADAVRMGASILDLLGSFMVFGRGLNAASAVTTGTAFTGYLVADMWDVIDGKADFTDAIVDNIKNLGVMAFPMFVNPVKAKALGAGDKMQKLAGLVSKWWGTAVSAGLLTDPEFRTSLAQTIKKTFSNRILELDAHDFSNWAFILRSVGGTKEMLSRAKQNMSRKSEQKKNKTGVVNYTIKHPAAEGQEPIVEHGVLEVTPSTNLTKQAVIKSILEKVNKDKVDENGNPKVIKAEGEEVGTPIELIKPEQIEVALDTRVSTKAKQINTSDENKKVKVDWSDGKDFTDLETEAWFPERIWQKATRNGKTVSRENTAFGKWMRGILGEEFDVPFSDYELAKATRINKVKKIGTNLFGGIRELKQLGEELQDIRKQGLENNWTQERIDGALLSKMNEYGFGSPNSEQVILMKANELSDFYQGTLSKLDDMEIAMRMLGMERPELENLESVSDALKQGEKIVTPEELAEAYSIMSKQLKEETPEGEVPALMKQLEENPKKDIVEKVFSAFNVSSASKLVKLNEKSLLELIRNTKAYKTMNKNNYSTEEIVSKIIEEIKNKHQLSKAQEETVKKVIEEKFNLGSVPSNKKGGHLQFARTIIKAQQGVKIGGIQLTNPSNPNYDDWYGNYYQPYQNTIFSDLQEYIKDNANFLFDPEDEDSIYQQLLNHETMAEDYNANYDPYQRSLKSDNSTVYTKWLKNYWPSIITENSNSAASKGRYSRKGTQLFNPIIPDNDIEKYKETPLYAARVRDAILLGGRDYMSQEQMQSFYSELMKNFSDKLDFYTTPRGNIFPVLKGAQAPEGATLLTDKSIYTLYGNTAPEDEGVVDGTGNTEKSPISEGGQNENGTENGNGNGNGNGDDETWRSSEFGYTDIPTDNINLQKLLYTIGMNVGNWDIANTYKTFDYKQIPNPKGPYREYGNDYEIRKTNQRYNSQLSDPRNLYADARLNTAIRQNIQHNYNTDMLAAEKVDTDTRRATHKEAEAAMEEYRKNITDVTNANILSEFKGKKEKEEIKAATKKANLLNWKNLIEKQFAERELLNDYRRSAFISSEQTRLQQYTANRMKTLKNAYWRKFSDLYQDDVPSYLTEDNFLESKEFLNSSLGSEYRTEAQAIEQEYLASYNDLLNETYKWPGYSTRTRYYGYYKPGYYGQGDQEKINEKLEKAKRNKETTVPKSKNGGILSMARGGASVNWVKVENARMLNKNINTTIKETYRNLREANNELQKTIRAMEPLIRQLQKREIVKQK